MASSQSQLSARIDALLPQTQCTRCGFPACRDYADAIARGEADFNQCPPGGAAGIAELAALLGREAKPLNPANGAEKAREVAVIDEEICIGCTKCIQACPVDAIVGASKAMHTVIADECSGCELCIAPCPVDCIAMVPVATQASVSDRAAQYRARYDARAARLRGLEEQRTADLAARKSVVDAAARGTNAVADAVARARAKKLALRGGVP
ncbi:MAG TPA: electron transport complex subunit RsxB [Rudaea sp.]